MVSKIGASVVRTRPGFSLCTASGVDRIEPRTLAFGEPDFLSKRVRNDQDVGKENCGVKAKSADGLERDLAGKRRRKTKIQKVSRLRAKFAIFRQIAACLPHQPDRMRFGGFAA